MKDTEIDASGDGAEVPEELIELFAPFLQSNSGSSIEPVGAPDSKDFVIANPWSDSSLEFLITQDKHEYIANALNTLILPKRFSAIWHKDSKDFEIIWTAFINRKSVKELNGREFTFTYDGKPYKCEFSACSDELIVLADAFQPVSATNTQYRNLLTHQMYVHSDEKERDAYDVGRPVSFWIRSVDLDEDELAILIYHLNFYMSYFDEKTPLIIIHAPVREEKSKTRYIDGSFPKSINARSIDLNLLHFWNAARDGDEVRRFIYYYRIIEYSAALYIENSARMSVRKALAKPNILDDVAAATEILVTAVQQSKMDDFAKLQAMIRDLVDPSHLWTEIEAQPDVFTKKIHFDGGFTLDPLVAVGITKDQYCTNALDNFCRRIKDIRNALSHGRDMRTSSVIAPTHRNYALLQPWVLLISVAAGEVLLYNDVV
ncbi:hypothetical protein [Methyloceanibacter sp.]|uniref:hypothetical protein n=1 Tax=Methyloceanibacter sp. TaxID=1965321 RepID=UPI002B82EE26|nr:hypothetical protein [Methyloceanibacter sp.]HML91757.1 hypothetical protein [Methyloceanibacter sp.]